MSEERKIWLVEHPTHQFKEDVKKLARKNDLIIVDAKFADQYEADQIAKGPKLTKIEPEQPEAKPDGEKAEGEKGPEQNGGE